MVGMLGIHHPGYMLGIHHPVYMPPYTPWVHLPTMVHPLPTPRVRAVQRVSREECLGSVLRLIMEMKRREAPRALRVLLFLGSSAQGYSALPCVKTIKIG